MSVSESMLMFLQTYQETAQDAALPRMPVHLFDTTLPPEWLLPGGPSPQRPRERSAGGSAALQQVQQGAAWPWEKRSGGGGQSHNQRIALTRWYKGAAGGGGESAWEWRRCL